MNKLLISVLTGLLLFGSQGLMAQDDNDVSDSAGIKISIKSDDAQASEENGIKIVVDTDNFSNSIQSSIESVQSVVRSKIITILGDEVNFSTDWETFEQELEDLTPEQQRRLEDQLEFDEIDVVVNGLDFGRRLREHGTSAGEVLIATTAIVFTLGMPILILLLVLLFAHRRRKQKMALVKTYIDANQTVPEHVLAEFDNPAGTHLSSGVKWVGIGLGVALTIAILSEDYRLVAVGLIPLFIGLGRLVLWKLEDR